MVALPKFLLLSVLAQLFPGTHGAGDRKVGMVRYQSGHAAVAVVSNGEIQQVNSAPARVESVADKTKQTDDASQFPHLLAAADRSAFLDQVLKSFINALPVEGRKSVFDDSTSFALLLRLSRTSLIPTLTSAQEKALCRETLKMKHAIHANLVNPSEISLPWLLQAGEKLNLIRSMVGEDDSTFHAALVKVSAPTARQRVAEYAQEVARLDRIGGPPPPRFRDPVGMINQLWSLHNIGVLDRKALDDITLVFQQSWWAYDVHDWSTGDYRRFVYGITHMIINDAGWYQKFLEPGHCDSKYGELLIRLRDLASTAGLLAQIDVDQAAEIELVLRQCQLEKDSRFVDLAASARNRVFDFARANRKGAMSHFLCGPRDWTMDCVHSSYVALMAAHGHNFHAGPQTRCPP